MSACLPGPAAKNCRIAARSHSMIPDMIPELFLRAVGRFDAPPSVLSGIVLASARGIWNPCPSVSALHVANCRQQNQYVPQHQNGSSTFPYSSLLVLVFHFYIGWVGAILSMEEG